MKMTVAHPAKKAAISADVAASAELRRMTRRATALKAKARAAKAALKMAKKKWKAARNAAKAARKELAARRTTIADAMKKATTKKGRIVRRSARQTSPNNGAAGELHRGLTNNAKAQTRMQRKRASGARGELSNSGAAKNMPLHPDSEPVRIEADQSPSSGTASDTPEHFAGGPPSSPDEAAV